MENQLKKKEQQDHKKPRWVLDEGSQRMVNKNVEGDFDFTWPDFIAPHWAPHAKNDEEVVAEGDLPKKYPLSREISYKN